MKMVTVIPLKKGIFKEDLTYFTAKDVTEGSIVTIPIRSKETLGLAVSVEEVSSSKSDIKNMSFELRKILDVKEHSVFSDAFLTAGLRLATYFAAQKGTTLTTLLPASVREGYDQVATYQKNSSSGEKNVAKNIQPEKLLFQSPLEERLGFYKTLVRSSFAEKKSVYIVFPTERDITVFKESLSRGVEHFTFTIHPGLSAKKQLEVCKAITETAHAILVLCTTQFLSIAREDIGTIVIEHESAGAYKLFQRPLLDLRVFIEIFAEKIGAKLILADTLLRFETIARQGTLSVVRPLSFRLNWDGQMSIKNPNEGHDTPDVARGLKHTFTILSEENIAEIQKVLDRKQNVFIFSLRKGLATTTLCADCAEIITCDNCATPVVLYLSRDGQKRMFICNRCHTEKDPLLKCPHCDSWNLTTLGIGTDTVTEELAKHFKKTTILKLDKESAKTEAGAEKIMKEFEASHGAILVGTEMAFFYMQEKVALSLVASFDSLWSIPNFKMSEKILHIIFSLVGHTKEQVLIQTKNEKDDVLRAVLDENILSFVREELKDREMLGYPPYKKFIKVSYLGDKESTLVNKKYLAEIFKDYDPEIFSGFVSKTAGKYTTNLLIKINPLDWPNNVLLAKLEMLSPEFVINIDPEDLL